MFKLGFIRQLKLDLLLMKCFVKNWDGEFMTFDAMFTALFAKMGHMHQIKRVYADKKDRDAAAAARRIYKGKFQLVEFKLEQRGGNKKVTHIYNLGPFELDPNVLQSKLKKDIGCSVTVNEPQAGGGGANDYFLTVQGNQIYLISELLKSKGFNSIVLVKSKRLNFKHDFVNLIDDFGIQLKHMKGLELGVKNN
jgi:translation initiation factor 1 (eIF-1/SUI1)